MLFHVRFEDETEARIEAPDLAAAGERVRQLYGPGPFTLEPEDPADPATLEAEEILADGRPERDPR